MKKILIQRINADKSLVNAPPWLKKIHKDEARLTDLLLDLQATKGELSYQKKLLRREARETTSAKKLLKIQSKIDNLNEQIKPINYKSRRVKYYLESVIELEDFKITKVETHRDIKKLRRDDYPRKVDEIKTIMTFAKPKDFKEWTPEIIRSFTKENFEKMSYKEKTDRQQAKDKVAQIHHGRIIIGLKISDDQVDDLKNRKRKEGELKEKFNKDNAYLFNRIIRSADKSKESLEKIYKQERAKYIKSQRPESKAKRKELSQKFDDRNKLLFGNVVKSRSKKPDALKKIFLKTRKDSVKANYQPVKRSDQGITYISTKRYDNPNLTTSEALAAIERFKEKYVFSGIGLDINDVAFSETLSTTFYDDPDAEEYDEEEEEDQE